MRQHVQRFIRLPRGAVLALGMAWAALSGQAAEALAAPAPALGHDGRLCRQQTDLQGPRSGMPPNLLTALLFVESGRWDPELHQKSAWPWTVMAEGKGRMLESKQEAIAEVRRLQMRGVRNIDVGCMQINLYYHADAFDSLEEAFDPALNIAYAVDFIQALYRETGSWQAAAVRYHSATPEYANRYRIKLMSEWNELNQSNPGGSEPAPQLASLPHALTRPGALRPLQPLRPLPPVVGQLARSQAASEKIAETERQRAEAKAFAENWRAQKLAEYLKAKQERLQPKSGAPGAP